MNKCTFVILAGLLLSLPVNLHAAEEPVVSADPYANETPEQRDARMAWWREVRFGLFIHWGVYAVPAGMFEGKPVQGYGEWILYKGEVPIDKYKAFAGQFNPTRYDADAWVLLAKRAGMKYIIITAKHHDGFALWPTAVNDWDIEATPYKKDLLKPLAEACKKYGLKLGFYYSQAQDWINGGAMNRDPDNKRTMDHYVDEIAVPQVRELLTNYGDFPVIFWWDTPAAMNEDRAAKLIEPLKLKPGIIHNNRLLKVAPSGVVDVEAIKSGRREPFQGDTETPEQHIPATGLGDRDFEVCMTMNDTWGYKSDDHNWKSTRVLLQQLIDIVSKGGNYLLNVGPTGEGLIPQASVERLEEIGTWMAVNSESIYGTTASPFEKLSWGRCTAKPREGGATLYLHVFDWPADGRLLVPGLKNELASARLLVTGEELTFERAGDDVLLTLPAQAPDANASVIKVEIQGKPDVVQMVALAGDMTASSTWPVRGFEAGKANDDNSGTRWSAAEGTRNGWLEIDLGAEKTAGRAFIREAHYRRTEEFILEHLDGDTWKELAKGTTIAGEKLISFTPVTASRFRLNILKASDVPTIEEFTLYGN